MKSKAFLPRNLLPLEDVKIGRLITNRESPGDEFYGDESLLNSLLPNINRPKQNDPVSDPGAAGEQNTSDPATGITPFKPPQSKIVTIPKDNFKTVLKEAAGTAIITKLTELISANSSFSKLKKIEVESLFNQTQTLQNTVSLFKTICQAPEAREWIEDKAQTCDIYMIVGFETVMNARVSLIDSETKEKGGEVGVSASAALLAATGVYIPGAEALDVSAGGTVTKDGLVSSGFTAPGEMVYAVRYQKLKWGFLSSKSPENARLGQAQWELVLRIRDAEDEDTEADDENDMIDIWLEEESDGAETENPDDSTKGVDIRALDVRLELVTDTN
ncbi:hypothetical protein TWF694_003786 [Orbilia ellipsospora]|uniref:Uncharacterized protein n=1 Tax=Orbilia ellipsospora TaxID=2528407 RepID=A0AAV9X0E9_9PEZI